MIGSLPRAKCCPRAGREMRPIGHRSSSRVLHVGPHHQEPNAAAPCGHGAGSTSPLPGAFSVPPLVAMYQIPKSATPAEREIHRTTQMKAQRSSSLHCPVQAEMPGLKAKCLAALGPTTPWKRYGGAERKPSTPQAVRDEAISRE